jgi:hypothetical protein
VHGFSGAYGKTERGRRKEREAEGEKERGKEKSTKGLGPPTLMTSLKLIYLLKTLLPFHMFILYPAMFLKVFVRSRGFGGMSRVF